LESVQIIHQGDAGAELRARIEKLNDFSALMPRLGELAVDSEKKDIDESRSPAGAPYPPLKNPRGISEKPLFDTGTMYGSIHFEVGEGNEVFAGPSLAEAPYFPYQNQGTSRGIPARSFIGLREEDNASIVEIVQRHAAAAMGQAS
jgi:phage gpG-like protein